MFRVLLTILIGLPMLMPPGTCICQFVPCGRASADETRLPSPGETAVSAGADSGGCGHCRRRSEQTNQEPGKPGGESIPIDHSSPVPLPGQHAPGCPAACTTSTEKVALPTSQVQTLLVLALDFIGFTTVVKASIPAVQELDHVHSPPLFLSHCKLLI